MADDPVDGPADQAPNFLTVHQTADVLQLGRSTTYELVGLFVESNGAAGIPAVMCGGQYRIPRGRLEAWNGGPISWPPMKRKRTRRSKRAPEDIQAGPADISPVERSGDAGPTEDADAPPLTANARMQAKQTRRSSTSSHRPTSTSLETRFGAPPWRRG